MPITSVKLCVQYLCLLLFAMPILSRITSPLHSSSFQNTLLLRILQELAVFLRQDVVVLADEYVPIIDLNSHLYHVLGGFFAVHLEQPAIVQSLKPEFEHYVSYTIRILFSEEYCPTYSNVWVLYSDALSVASLGLVSTDRCRPIFSWKSDDLF